METLLESLPNLHLRGQVRGDDTVDQFHHYVTVYLFVFAGFLIGVKEFVGEPLDCWVNMSNFQHFQAHVNSYCWAHRMYKYPNMSDYGQVPYPLQPGMPGPGKNFTLNDDLDNLGELNFYRWVTVIFFIQAFLFKLPALIWSELNEYSGTQIQKMVSMVTDSTFDKSGEREEIVASMSKFIETWLKINRRPFKFMKTKVGQQAEKILRYCMLCVGGNTGNYLSTMYLVVKFLFLFNVFIQYLMLTSFLDFNYWNYGPDAVHVVSADNHNDAFPRVGLCHFQLRGEGFWIQCILSINMLLEIIFLVEWFWLLLLLIITCLSFISWILKILQTQMSVAFITRYLVYFTHDGTLPKDGAKTVSHFVLNYLGNDGVFVLRILATNTNDVAMAYLVNSMWNRYLVYENFDIKASKEPQKG